MDHGDRLMSWKGREQWVKVQMEEKEPLLKEQDKGKYTRKVSTTICQVCTWLGLWGIQLVLWILLFTQILKECNGEEYITLISDPYGFQPVRNVTGVPVTCVTKEFSKWGCQPLGAYPDPNVEYRSVSPEILKEVYLEDWPWNTYHWPLWQMENVREWMMQNKAEYERRSNTTKEGIDDLLAGKIRGRFCVPYPYALLKCEEWCWYATSPHNETGQVNVKINCSKAVAVSCTEVMPLSSLHRVYWDKEDEAAMKFMNIKACNNSGLRCLTQPGGCVEGYPIPPGAEIIPESMKYLRGKKSQYGGIKDKKGELKLPLSQRVWVRLANLTNWRNGTPPWWEARPNGSTGINGTRWGTFQSLHHLGYNISSNPEKGVCNYTGKVRIGQEAIRYWYRPSWNCSQNWTGYPVWHVFRYLDMMEDKTSRCIQRPQRKNITVGNNTVTGNCSVHNWDGCNCTKSGNYLYNSTTGGLLVIICRENTTLVGIMGTNTNWTMMMERLENCSECTNATLENTGQGTLGGVSNTNCTLPHINETKQWTCKARQRNNKMDSLYIAGRNFWGRVKDKYSCESNLGDIDGMMHQQILLQRYQVIKVRAYTYGVIDMPENYQQLAGKRSKRDLSHKRKKRGVGLVIMLVIMAIVAAAGASLGVANAIQQSYTRAAVQTLANATAAQQDVLEATYAMVQHVAKGVRILEARVARVETLVDRMMLYQELDCWHYHQYCVTSTRSEIVKYINWTRFRDNCTWQEWETELEEHEGNITLLLKESARQTQLAQEAARRIPDVWKAVQEAFDWSGWFSWLKYIPIIVIGIIGCIVIRVLICVLQPLIQVYKTLATPSYQKVTIIMETRPDVGEEETEDGGNSLERSCRPEERTQPMTIAEAWSNAVELWNNSPWRNTWKQRLIQPLVLPLTVGLWINGRIGERHKNKKERVDCESWEKED
uniref:Envelope glycoprotein n=1 Tax=Caprine arthritis encephalitis virus TaxID=11660 RepID=F6LY14_CAEV|nr:envelope glycoprotein [Caprine arthritis encephalitis virus]